MRDLHAQVTRWPDMNLLLLFLQLSDDGLVREIENSTVFHDYPGMRFRRFKDQVEALEVPSIGMHEAEFSGVLKTPAFFRSIFSPPIHRARVVFDVGPSLEPDAV